MKQKHCVSIVGAKIGKALHLEFDSEPLRKRYLQGFRAVLDAKGGLEFAVCVRCSCVACFLIKRVAVRGLPGYKQATPVVCLLAGDDKLSETEEAPAGSSWAHFTKPLVFPGGMQAPDFKIQVR